MWMLELNTFRSWSPRPRVTPIVAITRAWRKAKPKESLKLFFFHWRGATKPPPSWAGGPHPAQLMPRTPPFCLPHR